MEKSKNTNSECCSGSSCCCGNTATVQRSKKSVVIDFLYLDLSVCTWCQGTEKSLEEALNDVSSVLKASGFEVKVNKINVTSEELAIKHRFLSSPTIRVNGADIQMDIKEKKCESCGDLCGDSVDCRVWEYNGVEYTVPPKALIVEGILKRVFGSENNPQAAEDYKLPENLKRFYALMNEKSGSQSCCGNANTGNCCG